MLSSKKWILGFAAFWKTFVVISASTHWIVTENGRIQSHLDSPFHLRRPYDLAGLLDQELRLIKIDGLYKELVSHKGLIDEKWSALEGATELETRVYSQDEDCLKAGKLLGDIDLYASIAADGSDRDGIKASDFVTDDGVAAEPEPDCRKAVELDFSMFAFEHLAAMMNRLNASVPAEKALELRLEPGMTVDVLGRRAASGLSRNSSSWLHHNLAVVYWRIKGDAYQATECGRRAVHFAPREYRDIALLNLAGVFHQARSPGEAAVILHAAVDHAPRQPINHLALGNVYAVLGDYNRSVACYDNFLKLRPGLQEALTTKHATLCHRALQKSLMELHESLQGILSELHDYNGKQERWLRLHERSMREQSSLEVKLAGESPETLSSMLSKRGQSCGQRSAGDAVTCDVNTDGQLMAHNLHLDISLNLQMLLRNVETSLGRRAAERERERDDTRQQQQQQQQQQCPRQTAADPRVAFFLPPPENKGFDVVAMLSENIGLGPGAEHPLPWHPPLCRRGAGVNNGLLPRDRIPPNARLPPADPRLRAHLLSYVEGGRATEAEVGQRIVTATERGVGPRWLLATLAGWYWRIRGHAANAADCLREALDTVPSDAREVPLAAAASLLQELDRGGGGGGGGGVGVGVVTTTAEQLPALYVYDASGTYPLSSGACRNIRDADWSHFGSSWQTMAMRDLDADVAALLAAAAGQEFREGTEPVCERSEATSPLDLLVEKRLRERGSDDPDSDPDPFGAEWLGIVVGDRKATVREIGRRIGGALRLRRDSDSWLLATTAAVYWRAVGRLDEAAACSRQALKYAPSDFRDVPLANVAGLLQQLGYPADALDVAYMALDSRPAFVVNHFVVANMHRSMGNLEKAVSFYRSALALDADFEPARDRLQAILCSLFYDDADY